MCRGYSGNPAEVLSNRCRSLAVEQGYSQQAAGLLAPCWDPAQSGWHMGLGSVQVVIREQEGNMGILEELRLDGKVALVTGASRGIGQAMALAFAEAGADLALVARSAGDLERVAEGARKIGRRTSIVPLDVSHLDAIPRMVQSVTSALGRVDILVNAAGVTWRQPLVEATPANWDHVVNTNLRSVYFVCQAVGRMMIAQRSGKIINLASMTSFRGFADISLYGVTKAGVVILTKTLAVEWAPFNVQVNAIAPGWIDTAMTSTMAPERRRWVEAHVPQGHFGTPGDVTGLAIYLASRASDYVTGQVFPVDGGFTAGSPW